MSVVDNEYIHLKRKTSETQHDKQPAYLQLYHVTSNASHANVEADYRFLLHQCFCDSRLLSNPMPSTSRPLSFVSKEPCSLQDSVLESTDETRCNNSSASTFSVGLRVVGWKSVDSESKLGEGIVGTVVEVGSESSSLAENTTVIQWDTGRREVYKAGHRGGQQISVLDNSSVGIKHGGVTCCACKQSPIAGIRWNCLDCKDSCVNLCTSCYMDDKHEIKHVFLRFDALGRDGIPVKKRSTTNKLQTRGLYPDAIVTRGPDWQYGDQDGGWFGTVKEIINWHENPASGAKVAWVSGTEGTYRRGYQGKVDLKCITASSGGFCYKSHLPRLGPFRQTAEEAEGTLEQSYLSEKDVETGEYGWESIGSGITDDASEEPSTADSSSSGFVDSDSQKLTTDWEKRSFQAKLTTDWEKRGFQAKASRGELHKASICGQLQAVKVLLDVGEDVNQGDKFSLTPLHLAAWYGQDSVLELLLERGANVNASDRFQKTPLQKAERHNHQTIMQILKKHGATSNYQQPLSLKSLSKMAVLTVDRRTGFNLLQAAVYEGDYEKVLTAGVLLDNFAREMNFESTANNAKILPSKTACDMLSTLDKQDHAKIKAFYEQALDKIRTLTELHQCGDIDDAEMAVELVLHHDVDVNIAAKGNRTPLLWASLRCSSEFAKTLIDLGADTNLQREDECSPLLLATFWNNYMTARLLNEIGVNTDVQEVGGNAALHISASHGFVNIAQHLIETGCSVNLQNNSGKTPLHLAVENKHKHVVHILLENNADVSIRDKQNPKERVFLVRGKDKGKPAWHYVDVKKAVTGLFYKRIKDGSLDVANFGTVLSSGWGKDPPTSKREEIANVDSEVTTETKDKTALHISCEIKDETLIELLVKYGADINACDADGLTPLHLAAIHGNMQVVKKLVELKADVNLTTEDGKDAADYAQMNEETEIEEYLKSKKSPFKKLWNRLSKKR